MVSRSYALGVLLGLGFVAMRTHRPGQLFWPWVLLGLLANTSVFGTLWSLVMGGFFAAQHWQKWRAMLRGAGLYAAFMALAIATMIPASDFALYAAKPNLGSGNLDIALNFVAGAFLPFYAPFMPEALNMIGGPAARLAATPWGLETDSQLVALLAWLPEYAVVGLLLAVPLLVCFSIMRDSMAHGRIHSGLCWRASVRSTLEFCRCATPLWDHIHCLNWHGVDVAERRSACATHGHALDRAARDQRA